MISTAPITLSAQALPELNDSATLIMNNSQEIMLGQQVMLNVNRKFTFSEDILLKQYLQTLANKLAAHSPREIIPLKMGLVVDPVINAFAVPGGYITVNTGLIASSQSEDELAAVIAHEIGHHSQRHIARSIERRKQLSLPTAIAMIGGVLVGGQAGIAAAVSAQGAAAADQLAYSRKFEGEADASGMTILATASYDPEAMPAFFAQLEKQSQLYGGQTPDFLRTHPVSSNRIADSLDRAARLDIAPKPHTTTSGMLDYAHAKSRLEALYNDSVKTLIARLKLSLSDDTSQNTQRSVHYGLGLAYMRKGDFASARDIFENLLRRYPDQLLYMQALATLYMQSGNTQDAQNRFATLFENNKQNHAVIHGYASALISKNEYSQAIRILRKLIRHQPNTYWAYELLSQAYGENNQPLNAAFSKAQKLKRQGQYKQALQLLEQQASTQHPDESGYLRTSIDDLIKQTRIAKQKLDDFKL